MNTAYTSVLDAIAKYDSFLLSAHVNPEGDCFGSLFAFEYLLTALGKKTTLVCHDPIPCEFSTLGKHWHLAGEYQNAQPFSCAVIIDCPCMARIGDVQRFIMPNTTIINVDHHISNQSFGSVNLVEPHASSCGEIIFDLFRAANVAIPNDVARFLYISIVTDTGSFRYENTSAKTHAIVSELMKNGLNTAEVNKLIYSNNSVVRVRLMGYVLSHVSFSAEGKIAWSSLQSNDFSEIGAQPSDAEGLVEALRDIRDVEVAFCVIEHPDGESVNVSFRSKEYVNVNDVARSFGGGGHTRAAGCKPKGDIDEIVKRIIERIKEEMSKEKGKK